MNFSETREKEKFGNFRLTQGLNLRSAAIHILLKTTVIEVENSFYPVIVVKHIRKTEMCIIALQIVSGIELKSFAKPPFAIFGVQK